MELNQHKEVFCICCYGRQEQVYKEQFEKDGCVYKRYVCCQCGTENDIKTENNI